MVTTLHNFKVLILLVTCLLNGPVAFSKSIDVPNTHTHTASVPTRFPIILAHGILASDGLRGIKKIRSALRSHGHQVFLTEVNAIGSVELRASQLARQVIKIASDTASEKVNIIAHSMGGLDARYAITQLGLDRFVATLTTVSTPHRGTSVVDQIIEEYDQGQHGKIFRFLEIYGSLINGATSLDEADAYESIRDLTTYEAKTFNDTVPDSPSVYYQSYAASADINKKNGIHRVLRKAYGIIYQKEGSNDGLVSNRSAKWGTFKGVVAADHYSVTGLGHPKKAPFDAPTFYQKIAFELSISGF